MPLKTVTCPKCQHDFEVGSERYCFKCKKQIGNSHKWHFTRRGTVEHRNCKDPQSYK